MRQIFNSNLSRSLCSLALLGFLAQAVSAQSPVVSSQVFGKTTIWHINYPPVTGPLVPGTVQTVPKYFLLDLTYMSQVLVSAGGCVQTGGKGLTWKRYVDPQGPNSDRLYHGMIGVPGLAEMRIDDFIARYPAGYLNYQGQFGTAEDLQIRLSYEDDGPSDNGYYSHDNGTGNQCANIGPAWVTITVIHPE